MSGDRVYALRTDGELHAINPATGEQKLITQLRGGSGGLAAIDGTLFAADDAGILHWLDPLTGDEHGQVRMAAGC